MAPLSGNSAGLRRAEIKPGVREIHLCKDERGKTGLQLKNVDQVRGWAGMGLCHGTGLSWNDVTWHKHDSRAQHHVAVYHNTAAWGIKCHSVPQHSRVQMARHGTAYHGAQHGHGSLCQPCATTPLCPQGIFVQLVKANSPAALVGLRFGDQVLQIDGKNCAGWSSDKAQRALKKANPEKIVMVVRDR